MNIYKLGIPKFEFFFLYLENVVNIFYLNYRQNISTVV